MNRMEDSVLSPSYFWSCLTLSEECPFFSSADPKLYYFAFGLTLLYAALLLTILFDLRVHWSLDNLYYQTYYYLNYIKTKLRDVHINQRRLVSTQERTEEQLKKCVKYNRMVSVIRETLANNPEKLSLITQNSEACKNSTTAPNKWNEMDGLLDFTDDNANSGI